MAQNSGDMESSVYSGRPAKSLAHRSSSSFRVFLPPLRFLFSLTFFSPHLSNMPLFHKTNDEANIDIQETEKLIDHERNGQYCSHVQHEEEFHRRVRVFTRRSCLLHAALIISYTVAFILLFRHQSHSSCSRSTRPTIPHMLSNGKSGKVLRTFAFS